MFPCLHLRIHRDAKVYAVLWGVDLDIAGWFDTEVKFMLLAHGEAEAALPWAERIDLEAFAEKWRPATYAEVLRAIAEDERRRRSTIPRS